MENKPDQPVNDNAPTDVLAAPEFIKPSVEEARPVKKGPGWVIVFLTLILVIIALLGSAYVWLLLGKQQQAVQGSHADVAGAIQRVDQQAGQYRQLQRQLDQQVDKAELLQRQLSGQIEQLQRQISSQQKRLNTLSTADRGDWLLAEAEYLIRLANQRLLMGKEVKGALDLLSAADDIVRELDDAALYLVRRALADDMAKLRSAAKLDIEGVYLQLGALAKQVDQLRLFELPGLQTSTVDDEVPKNWQQRVESGLLEAWHKLGSYIKINRRTEVYQPLLAPEYESAVRQNVHLMFEQAQMAALSGKQLLYNDSLKKATSWLQNYYRLDEDATKSLIDRIDKLAQLQIAVPLPDISGSLRELKNYLETIRSIPVVSEKNVEEAGQ